MKILILGAQGQLGAELFKVLQVDHDVIGLGRNGFGALCGNITDHEGIKRSIASIKPDVVINAAAYTNVVEAEKSQEVAFSVNAYAAEAVALACKNVNAYYIHFSTDFIFDGESTLPYKELDQPNPLSTYGKSKLLGEELVQTAYRRSLIVRVGWLFGEFGVRNFPKLILQKILGGDDIFLPTYELGSPTSAKSIAWAVQFFLKMDALIDGVIHLRSEGVCSRYQQGMAILSYLKTRHCFDGLVKIYPVEESASVVMRPKAAVLNNAKALSMGLVLPNWQDSQNEYIEYLLMASK